MAGLLNVVSYSMCAMTNRFPTKSLQIMNLAAILDV